MSKTKTTPSSKEDDLAIFQTFLDDPVNKQKALIVAKQIYEEVSKNWFTISKVCKKFQLTPPEAQAKLEVLKAFKICAQKYDDGLDQYKIDLNHEAQKQLLKTEIEAYQSKIKILKTQLSELG